MRQRLDRARARLQPRAAAAAIAVVLFAGLLIFAALESNREAEPAPASPVAPFRIEASIVTLSPVLADGGREEELVSTVVWWYESPRLWRWEIETTEMVNGQIESLLGVADDERVSVYDSSLNTYATHSFRDYPLLTLPSGPLLGPVNIDDVLEAWTLQGISVQSSGLTQPYLGREALVYLYTVSTQSGGVGARASEVGRIWYDPEVNLILRHTLDAGPNQPYSDARVLFLDLKPAHDRSLFRFLPPEGSIAAE